MSRHRIVIIGGGFAGLNAARRLARTAASVTLVDRRNVHVFQPLLYQVATGGLSPGDIASPLRWVLRSSKNTEVRLGDVVDLDIPGRRVELADGEVRFDSLVVAAGSAGHYFGNDGWEPWAPGLKTLEDALEIRRRVLLNFERAELELDAEKRVALMTFVVVGGGPTGVELAGALAELSRDTLRSDFRSIDPGEARILLVEASDRLLPTFPERLSARCRDQLERLGVRVELDTRVSDISADAVVLDSASGSRRVECGTKLWAAGVRPSRLAAALQRSTGCELDRGGRVIVGSDLSLPGHPEVFVIGDLAHAEGADGQPLPGLAPVAMQQGHYIGNLIHRRLQGRETPAFRYKDKGQLATIGRAAAVADLGPHLRFSGLPAWLLWLFVHIMYLVEFQNRLIVFQQWAWNYFTRKRGTRIISDERSRADDL